MIVRGCAGRVQVPFPGSNTDHERAKRGSSEGSNHGSLPRITLSEERVGESMPLHGSGILQQPHPATWHAGYRTSNPSPNRSSTYSSTNSSHHSQLSTQFPAGPTLSVEGIQMDRDVSDPSLWDGYGYAGSRRTRASSQQSVLRPDTLAPHRTPLPLYAANVGHVFVFRVLEGPEPDTGPSSTWKPSCGRVKSWADHHFIYVAAPGRRPTRPSSAVSKSQPPNP